MGRPSTYREDYAERAERLCLLGYTNEDLGRAFGVTAKTINEWRTKEPSFGAALKAGRDEADTAVVNALYTKARNGDTTAMIFWLKNRQSARWRDRHDHKHTGSMTVTLHPTDAGL